MENQAINRGWELGPWDTRPFFHVVLVCHLVGTFRNPWKTCLLKKKSCPQFSILPKARGVGGGGWISVNSFCESSLKWLCARQGQMYCQHVIITYETKLMASFVFSHGRRWITHFDLKSHESPFKYLDLDTWQSWFHFLRLPFQKHLGI